MSDPNQEEKWVEVRKSKITSMLNQNEKMIKNALKKRNIRQIAKVLSVHLHDNSEFEKLLDIVICEWRKRYLKEWTTISKIYHAIEDAYGLPEGIGLERILESINESNAKYILVSVHIRRILYDKCNLELGANSRNQIKHLHFLESMEAEIHKYL